MNKKTLKTLIIGGTIVSIGAGSLFVPATYALPSSSANTIINANIGSTISISTSGTVNLAITPTGTGSATSASDTVSVSTNSSNGYGLQLNDNDANTNLVNGANNIPASTGTWASPIATLANNTWGYRIDGAGSFGTGPTSAQTNVSSLTGKYAAVPALASPQTIKTTATTASGDTTTVWYGAMADTTKPNGTYTDTVVYTATANS